MNALILIAALVFTDSEEVVLSEPDSEIELKGFSTDAR